MGKEWGDAQSLPRASCKQINESIKYLNVCDKSSCKICSLDVELYIEQNIMSAY